MHRTNPGSSRRLSRALSWCLPAGLCMLLAACNSGGSKATVQGTVTLDDVEVKEGVVRFIPVDGNTPTASGPIKDGRYVAEVPHGMMRIEINVPTVKGKRKAYDAPDSPLVDIVEEAVPAKYNVQSELKEEIKGSTMELNFPLKSR